MKQCSADFDDIYLMLRVKCGDPQPFERLDQKYKPIIRGFLASRGCPESLLDDSTQEVFLRMWANRLKYQPTSALKTFILGIAMNVWREQRRRNSLLAVQHEQSTRFRTSSVASVSEAENQGHRQEIATGVLQAVNKLPAQQRQAIFLVHLLGVPIERAVRQVGCSRTALESRCYRGKQKLAELLDPLYKQRQE